MMDYSSKGQGERNDKHELLSQLNNTNRSEENFNSAISVPIYSQAMRMRQKS